MKPSYFQSPRQMRDATWSAWGEAFERPEPRTRFSARSIFLGVVSLALWSAFVLVVTS